MIRENRKLKGLSQELLASKAQLDRSYMGRIERGEVNITLKVLWVISVALSISVKELIPD